MPLFMPLIPCSPGGRSPTQPLMKAPNSSLFHQDPRADAPTVADGAAPQRRPRGVLGNKGAEASNEAVASQPHPFSRACGEGG